MINDLFDDFDEKIDGNDGWYFIIPLLNHLLQL